VAVVEELKGASIPGMERMGDLENLYPSGVTECT
jgi:hypothetical protein